MGRQGLMDDSGYHGFDECANYESCTNDFVAELLEPYDVTSIEELIEKARAKAKEESEAEHKAMCEICIHKVSKADIDAIYNQALEDFINKVCSLRIYDTNLCLIDLEEARKQLKK